ncbi:hypothetical protein SDC9_178860 [bioreactor metagenome]|uniref:Uncharacterized protein n=1 Tax=bioreactor metagenome TaxID=1076179 RepID=A0A645GYQ0_9ZZZZ
MLEAGGVDRLRHHVAVGEDQRGSGQAQGGDQGAEGKVEMLHGVSFGECGTTACAGSDCKACASPPKQRPLPRFAAPIGKIPPKQHGTFLASTAAALHRQLLLKWAGATL